MKASIGSLVPSIGHCRASAWSAVGFTLSGVPEEMRMSTLSLVIMSPATCAARLESDWVSAVMMVILCILPSPSTSPSPSAFWLRPSAHFS